MRDYSQYALTPTKKKDRNLIVTPSPASSSASFPNYRVPSTATKSQVAILNRSSQQLKHPQTLQQQSIQPNVQKRDAASISTAATQSSNDHSPRSSNSTEGPIIHGKEKVPSHQQQQSSYPNHAPLSQQQQRSMFATTREFTSLTPADALSLKRDGPEATIRHLRESLEEARVRDASEKSKLEKSDATILELRSSVRQLKRQLEKLDGETRQKHSDLVAAKQELQELKHQQRQQQPQRHSDDASSHEQELSLAKEERVGELQVQLDRAHAQILTADMVRKELEDTLEAEQYTWELRVQDQERTIADLQHEINLLADDLDQCRQQWKKADEEWARKVAELEAQLSHCKANHKGSAQSGQLQSPDEANSLEKKLRLLEEERNELQTCLDEALLELEAVDAELGSHTPAEVQQLRHENIRLQEVVQKQKAQQQQQGDAGFDTLAELQHLYSWLLERSEEEEKKNDSVPQTSAELLDSIHRFLESKPGLNGRNGGAESSHSRDVMSQKVTELESQLSLYKDDLQAREDSSAELRASLKEAVALIKPLQDSIDKAEQQKADLQQEVQRLRSDHELEAEEMQEDLRQTQQELHRKEQECERLRHDIHRLQQELHDARELAEARQAIKGLSPTAAAAAATAAHTKPPTEQPQELSSISKARADLRAKRAQEQTLRSLLRDAQNRFHTLSQQNQNVEAKNQELQGKLRDVEINSEGDVMSSNVGELERQITEMSEALHAKSREIEELREKSRQLNPEATKRITALEAKLAKAEEDLKHREQSQKVLNNSLKEALGLLKPLKCHLEEAEQENKDLSKEVRTLRRKVTSMEIGGMGPVVASPGPARQPEGIDALLSTTKQTNQIMREKEDLEETVRHLEQENSQLHDALDEMSRINSGNMAVERHNTGNRSVQASLHATSEPDARLNQELVELRSRLEVTQSRLEDAYVENHALVEALKEKEEAEKDVMNGMRSLREKLSKTEVDLENAKYIATSALVKVEQVKSQEHNISINNAFENDAHTIHSLEEKAIELDLLASAVVRSPQTKSPFQTGSNAGHTRNGKSFQYCQNPQEQQAYMSGVNARSNDAKNSSNGSVNSWAGKRSRLADF